MGNLEKIKNYFKEVKVEMDKVDWPSKDTTINYTLIVIGVSAATAVFLGALDYFFGLGIDIILFR
jgi:preprotein translocase subunit SecE